MTNGKMNGALPQTCQRNPDRSGPPRGKLPPGPARLCAVRIVVILFMCATTAFAKMDLVTVPNRDKVQLTIYNSADLTLVRETRLLTLKKGVNKLQFSWANTLIDPTSLSMRPIKDGDKIDVDSLIFPPRTKELGMWKVHSQISGKVPFEITYFTSGIGWRAFYMGTLSKDEKSMQLQGYVRVANNSGEEYDNAQTRLIVGKINLIDRIATLARRQHPYGSPYLMPRPSFERASSGMRLKGRASMKMAKKKMESAKQIKKEGLSEYFLYTIEGTETIANKWQKRLPSFDTKDIPVVNLYKFEEDRYGRNCVRFLSFKNDKTHKLGDTPIPGGAIKIYRNADEQEHLSYEGASSFKYIPVEQDVELNLGGVQDVIVKPKVMEVKTENFMFDKWGNVNGWDDVHTFTVTVKNTRAVVATVEITRNLNHKYWEVTRTGDFGKYEKVDMDTVKFSLELKPRSKKTFTYVLRKYQGKRQNRR